MKKSIMLLLALILVNMGSPVMAQESAGSDPSLSNPTPGGEKSLEERIMQMEEALGLRNEGGKRLDRIQISGLIEVEAGYEKIDFKEQTAQDEKTSDVDLVAVELAVDAEISDHIDGHVLFKYEDDEVFVDEGFITLTGPETFPAYLIAGRQYIPFGSFDTHFITDPATLVLGETNEGAVVAGYRFGGEMVDVSLGAFNGRAQSAGDDDAVDSFVANIAVNPCEDLMIGGSYTSNLAGSDAFNEVVTDPDNLDSLIAGWSVYATFRFLDHFKLIGECVSALDHFKAGEIYDAADARKRKPMAWNAELGFTINDALEIAARFGGSDDGGNFLPESEYGTVLNWKIFENTSLALEYLHDEFENEVEEIDAFTLKLAVEF